MTGARGVVIEGRLPVTWQRSLVCSSRASSCASSPTAEPLSVKRIWQRLKFLTLPLASQTKVDCLSRRDS